MIEHEPAQTRTEAFGDGAAFYFEVEAENGVPEPGTVALLGGGLVVLVGWGKRRK